MALDRRCIFSRLTCAALCVPLTACPDDDDDVAVTVTDTTGTGTTNGETTVEPPTTMPPTTMEPTTEPVTVTGTETGDGTVDETGEPADEGLLRVIHLSPDAPAVDVYLDPEGQAGVEALDFLEGTPFLPVMAGDYDVRVTAAGGAPRDAVISVDGFNVPASSRLSLAAYGELDDIDLMVITEDDSRIAPDTLRAFVGHAADGVNTVDVWAIGLEDDPVEVISDLDYGDWEPLDIPADTAFQVGLDADADGDPDFVFDIPALPEGITLSLFAVLDDQGPFLIAYLPDGSAAGPIRPNDD
jgi:hypothetical protein